jgi:hypothetical protein
MRKLGGIRTMAADASYGLRALRSLGETLRCAFQTPLGFLRRHHRTDTPERLIAMMEK